MIKHSASPRSRCHTTVTQAFLNGCTHWPIRGLGHEDSGAAQRYQLRPAPNYWAPVTRVRESNAGTWDGSYGENKTAAKVAEIGHRALGQLSCSSLAHVPCARTQIGNNRVAWGCRSLPAHRTPCGEAMLCLGSWKPGRVCHRDGASARSFAIVGSQTLAGSETGRRLACTHKATVYAP